MYVEEILSYKIPGISGAVTRVKFGERVVEFWGNSERTDKVLIAHDGQCIFDLRTAKRNTTWKLAETASYIAKEFETTPPLIIAIWHQGEVGDSVSRGLDLSPEDYFKSGMELFPKNGPFDVSAVQGNRYLSEIFDNIVPTVVSETRSHWTAEKTAMIGASRGALSTLYALSKHPDKFCVALAHSIHWPIGKNSLVEMTINNLPEPGKHFIWMAHGSEGFDAEYRPYQQYAHQLLLKKGFREHEHFSFTYYPGAAHNEASWSTQVPDSLRKWFEKIQINP